MYGWESEGKGNDGGKTTTRNVTGNILPLDREDRISAKGYGSLISRLRSFSECFGYQTGFQGRSRTRGLKTKRV